MKNIFAISSLNLAIHNSDTALNYDVCQATTTKHTREKTERER